MNASRIVASFLAFGTAWILTTDRALDFFVKDDSVRASLQSAKGIVFVLLSALLIYLLVKRAEHKQATLRAQTVKEKNHLAHILNINPAVIYSLRPSASGSAGFAVDFVGHNVEHVTGYSLSQWMQGESFWEAHLHPDDLAQVETVRQQLFQNNRVRHEYRLLHADGSYRWIDDNIILLRDTNGKPVQILGSWLDITERKKSEERLRLIGEVFQSSQEGIFITDAEAHFISVNSSFTHITGYTLEEVVGHTPALLHSGRHDQPFYESMWTQIRAEGRWEGEIWNRKKTGEIYPEWLTISAIKDDRGEVQQYLGIFTETSSRKAAEERIHRLANYDSLTSLPNRALLFDRAGVAFAAANRSPMPVAVLHLNVDHFRSINDSFGHAAGDQVLVDLAKRLTAHLKPEDTVSRTGNDDFVLLLPNTSARDAAQVASNLMTQLAQPFVAAGHEVRLTVSIGIAEFPENGADLAHLSQAAESAVRQAKREGRNTINFFSQSLQEQVKESLAVERDLRFAVERHELVLHYQAQVDIPTGKIIGVEALVRWQHPQWGLVPPAKFISIAEDSGLIREIGGWVMNEAMRQNAAWQTAGLPIVPVAINLSLVQFRHAGLRDAIIEALRQSGLPAHMLELELTESVAMEDSNFTITTIDGLKRLGVMLSIDDFGTGYSSLSYLKRFDVDKLKIDQSFVRGLNYDPEDEAIVATVINLARSLGLRTIAEGVETTGQLEFLRSKGCEEFQGYLFSRPVPAEEFAALLQASSPPG